MPKLQITIRMPPALKERVEAQCRADGYGPKGKSRWLWEAFYAMTRADPTLELVGAGDKLEGPNSSALLLTGDANAKARLDDAAFRLRPMLEFGARAMLMRSAVRMRLANPGEFTALVAVAKRRLQNSTTTT